MKTLAENRPTEIVSGLALAAAIYGFLTQAGVRAEVAALLGLALGVVPFIVSNTVDRIRSPRP